MKYLIPILLIFISSCGKEKKSEINYSINLYSTSIIRIKCENLRNSTNIKNVKLTKSESTHLYKIIQNLEVCDQDYGIDARLYGSIYIENKKMDFCMSTTIIEVDNKKFYVDSNLRNYIIKLTN